MNMIQAEKTSELMQYMEQISGVMNYVNQMFIFLANWKRWDLVHQLLKN